MIIALGFLWVVSCKGQAGSSSQNEMSCERLVDHILEVLDREGIEYGMTLPRDPERNDPEQRDFSRPDMIARCQADQLPPARRRCMLAATTSEALAACESGPERKVAPAATGDDAAASSVEVPDRSSPEAVIASVRAATSRWDLPAIIACFDVAEEEYDEFAAEFTAARDEITECFANAELGATEKNPDGTLSFGLLNCPSKSSRLTGRMVQKPDGTWRIMRL